MFAKLIPIVVLATLVVGCVTGHFYGDPGRADKRIPGWEVFVIVDKGQEEWNNRDTTWWIIDMVLRPKSEDVPDSSYVDLVEVFCADSSGVVIDTLEVGTIRLGETPSRVFMGNVRLTRPWPPTLIVKASFSLWKSPGIWEQVYEEFDLGYSKKSYYPGV